ncbi:putative gibberellin 3-beta-dioxygenase [Rosa chinensis]|uniref:Putative gibberellin 3-beta-dioxygenase n=1 Tax=Rosa chinensis TaxID=74649 RepID=A0A2P6RJ89_ROSCH|nr:gibberellin 3-beta-dioxygenase 1 [Rosa chinensis]PRQ46502.1 putative gibberellin 3-beta-dioxygenase [Rosa chinensis]
MSSTTTRNLSHIVPLDFNSIHTFPDSHTWDSSTDHHPFTELVPIIDLLDPNAASLIQLASEQWGVFQVTNHGIPMNLIQEAELQARGLFELPGDQKLQALVDQKLQALVVNVGDLMHMLPNGRFKTAVHRAVVNELYHRISIASFYSPPYDVKISPPMKLIDQDHPPLYQPVTWKEHLGTKGTHFNRALDLMRNDTKHHTCMNRKPTQHTFF